jgi:hypothetical protein
MNCDMAFELMTDAEGSRSPALMRHLDGCPRCRQMQETLAPALGFLAPSAVAGHPAHEPGPAFDDRPRDRGSRRTPLLNLEALKIAQQTAHDLTARSDTPGDRLKRRAATTLRYSTAFAAGLLLAFTLFPQRQAAVPTGNHCTWSEAPSDDRERPAGKGRALELTCAACHVPHQAIDARSAALDSQDTRHFERLMAWLVVFVPPPPSAAV